MNRRPVMEQSRRDDGFSLVELIIYVAVGAILTTVLATVFVAGWQADAATRDRDSATGAAQVITSSIQTSIRNAGPPQAAPSGSSGFKVDGGYLLRARVDTGAGGWECRAWRLANPRTIGGQLWYELEYNHGTTLIDDSSPGWRPLLGGLTSSAGEGVLLQGDPTADRPFGGYGSLLTLNLRILVVDLGNPTLDGPSIPVSGDVVAQTKGGVGPSCW